MPHYHPVYDDIWLANCDTCGKKLVRLQGNNAPYDPYFRQSKKARQSVARHRDNLLQPGDPGFDLLYPQHRKKREEYYEQKEIATWQNQK